VRHTRVEAPNPRVLGSLPERAADSYRELVELDIAQSVRLGTRVRTPRALEPDALDLAVLALIAGLRHVLTSQLHRHFNPGRAVTTTQRRLKRLSDAGLVERFQFHRRDGGGVPMCYVITPAGRELLGAATCMPPVGRSRSWHARDARGVRFAEGTRAR
jgi:DNA-binding HxlR family transcriptional regulator